MHRRKVLEALEVLGSARHANLEAGRIAFPYHPASPLASQAKRTMQHREIV